MRVLPTQFEWFLALRFLREGRYQTALTLAGVAVGVGVIVFLGALISGLQTSLIEKTLGSQPHVVVRPPDEEARPMLSLPGVAVAPRVGRSAQRPRTIPKWAETAGRIERVPGVVATSPVAAGAAFAVRGDVSKAVALRGVDEARFNQIVNVAGHLVSGRFRLGAGDVVIGFELAGDLGLRVGDKLRLSTAETPAGEVFSVAGTFDLGAKDVNERWVLAPLRTAQSLLALDDGITSIEVRVDDIFAAGRVAAEVADRTWLVAEPWTVTNAQLLVGLRSQNASSYMIQAFVVLAVALGIASVLVVSVVQKSREIGILKAIGTSTGAAQRVFLAQGAVIGLVGSAFGCALGVALAVFFRGLALAPDGSPIFPVDLAPWRFAWAAGLATVVGIVSAVFPARRAARLDPAQVIRYG